MRGLSSIEMFSDLKVRLGVQGSREKGLTETIPGNNGRT